MERLILILVCLVLSLLTDIMTYTILDTTNPFLKMMILVMMMAKKTSTTTNTTATTVAMIIRTSAVGTGATSTKVNPALENKVRAAELCGDKCSENHITCKHVYLHAPAYTQLAIVIMNVNKSTMHAGSPPQ